MKKMLVLLVCVLVASSAFAVTDPDSDMMGIYFDLTADSNCYAGATPYAQFPAYVMLTNPTTDFLFGFEFGYMLAGEGMVLSSVFPVTNAIDIGAPGNHIVGLGSPMATSEATVLLTMNLMYMSVTNTPVTFTLKGSNPSSIDPALPTILLADSVMMTAGTSTMPGSITAIINGNCEDTVTTDETSFGTLKSLYR